MSCRYFSPTDSFVQFWVKEAVVLFGREVGGSRSKFIRLGNATPSPKPTASPAPMVGMNSRRLAAASEIPARRISWSRSFVSRMEKIVLHWERMVGSSSAGLCVMMASDTPYLRPSLAIREMARLVGSKPRDLSFGTYR